MTGSAAVTINPLPAAYNVTGGGAYCAGGSGVPVGLSDSEAGSTTSFTWCNLCWWQLFQAQAQSFHLATRLLPELTLLLQLTHNVCIQNMTGSAAVTINPLPAAYNVTGSGAYCAGGTGVPVGLSDSEAGINYQLFRGATSVGAAVSRHRCSYFIWQPDCCRNLHCYCN